MTARDLTRALRGDWCGSYGLVPGPGHSRKDRSLKVWQDGDRILVHSFAGDGWQDCRAYLGLDADWRRDWPSPARRRAAPADDYQQPDRRAEALAIWEESAPALHTPAQDYLACRGITITSPSCIRYHAGISALVALVQAKDGSFSGIQRIYLETDARGTWRRSRYSLGPIKGGAVRLTPAAEILQLTESVEDGLGLLQMPGRATWAVPGAGFMESFEPPPEVKELVLAPDHDPAGLEAIEKAIKAATNRSLKLRRLLPPPGKDWCDVLEDFDERMAIQEEPELANSWAERFCNGV